MSNETVAVHPPYFPNTYRFTINDKKIIQYTQCAEYNISFTDRPTFFKVLG